MSTTALIMLFLEVIKQRAEAGFPLIKRLIEKWAKSIQDQVEKIPGVVTFGDAPPDLLNLLIQTLEKLRAETNRVGLKLVYNVLISLAPSAINKLWDRLFEMKHVATPATVQHVTDTFRDVDDDLEEFLSL